MVLILVGCLLIRSFRVQTWFVNQLTERLEQQYGGQIQVGKLLIRFPKQLMAEDVLLKDQLGDTLCYIREINAGIKKVYFKKRVFELGRIRIIDPYVQLLEDPGGGFNFDFITEMMTSQDTTTTPFFIKSTLISLRNGKLRFKKFGAYPAPDVFSPDNFEISKIELNMSRFNLNPDSINFQLRDFRMKESSGFSLKDMEGDFVIHDNRIEAEGFFLETPYSSLDIPFVNYYLPDFENKTSLAEQLNIRFRIEESSVLDPRDIRFFYPEIAGNPDCVNLSGDFSFNPETWQFSNAELSIGNWFGFTGNMDIKGPTDLISANYDSTVDTLWLDQEKGRQSYLALLVDMDTLGLPFDPHKLGSVYFKGKLHRRKNDFRAEGKLRSGAGAFNGMVSVKPMKNSDLLKVSADYRVSLIHLDNFLKINAGIGLVSADGNLEGTWNGDSIYSLKVETLFPFIQWKGYYYTNVKVKSFLENKLYEAAIIVNDEYGKLDFAGKVDMRRGNPVFDFDVYLQDADLAALNLYPIDSIANLDLNLHASFSGKEIDDLEGQLWIEDSRFSNSRGDIPVKELHLEISRELNRKKIVLVSEFIDGRMVGDIYLDDLVGQLTSIGGRFLPVNIESKIIHEDRMNDFIFNIHFKNPRPLTDVLASNFVFKENTKLSGSFRYAGRELEVEGSSPQYLIEGKQFSNLRFRLNAFQNDLSLVADLDKIQLDQNNSFNEIHLTATMLPNSLETSLSWKGNDTVKYLSEINPSVSFVPGRKTLPRIIIDLPNSTVFYKKKQWELSDSRFEIDNHYFSVDNLLVSNQEEQVLVDGVVSDLPGDTLNLNFKSLDLGIVNQFSSNSGFQLSGLIEGDTKIFNFYDGGLFLADLRINDFIINGEQIGLTEVRSWRGDTGDDILINILTKRGDISTLQMDGKYSPNTDKLDFIFKLDKLRLNMFNPFLSPVLSGVNGIASGDVRISGTRQKPIMNGLINVQKGSLRVDYLNTRYTFTHPIIVQENAFLVENLTARDSLGNEAIINGGIRHTDFKDLRLDLRINAKDFLFMNTDEFTGDDYWGTAFGTGVVSIKGPLKNIYIDVSARTSSGTQFSFPVSGQGNAREIDFITYVVHQVKDEDPDLISFDTNTGQSGYKADLNNLRLHLDIDITPQAEAFLIFDAQIGDVMRGRGTGNLQIDINTLGLFTLNGGFNIDEGEYLFTLQNMPIKRFAIEPGSTINWTGKVEDAQLDIDAVYNTKAALYDLLLEESDGLTERLPVTCHLLMNGILESPDISFAINLPPNSNDFARSQLESLTEDELNKQLFSLLILGRFQPLPGLSSTSSRSYGNAGLATTTEVLSSQLNYWLSQISNDFDIGLNYRPGDQITSDEVEVALSTQIFNNRMIINLNGNVDMRSSQHETNQLVGDVDVEYKIKPSGRVRVKAFNRSNDRLIYEYSPYTQGLGLFFREEFNSLSELYQKYWRQIMGNKNSAKE